jgi:hypothetical protein
MPPVFAIAPRPDRRFAGFARFLILALDILYKLIYQLGLCSREASLRNREKYFEE